MSQCPQQSWAVRAVLPGCGGGRAAEWGELAEEQFLDKSSTITASHCLVWYKQISWKDRFWDKERKILAEGWWRRNCSGSQLSSRAPSARVLLLCRLCMQKKWGGNHRQHQMLGSSPSMWLGPGRASHEISVLEITWDFTPQLCCENSVSSLYR